jgi:type 1 fimbria pilin
MNIKITDIKGAILNTEGKYCEENIKIVLDESIKQPKGNLELTVNGIADVSDYATVTINVPTSSSGGDIAVIDVESQSDMEQLLVEENIGKVYRYTGETNDKFVYGALYQATEEE